MSTHGTSAGQRMFVAVVPPTAVRDDLSAFLAVRDGMTWIDPSQWHVTLAFCASVPTHRVEELVERLAIAAARQEPFTATLAGAGAFPSPDRASVLWLGVEAPPDALDHLALTSRNAANQVGANPDGKRFTAHLSVARLRRPISGTKWLRVLDAYRSPSCEVDAIELVASRLGAGPGGRPLHEVVACLPLGGRA
ncbi:MAG TPA: RNA 2',3'-cyclic phosphodiesterase [Propionibacteriaceae bacterium]|nr:RNA 2',3'-cyclic phosphodiesterase [Propionibacteriaceae bacterium]